VVGAGLAGARCAETLRAEGFAGNLVIVGDEPLPPYERPALSKDFLLGLRSIESLGLRPPDFWDERGIRLLLGRRVVAIDHASQRATTDRGETLGWNALVVATGGRVRQLPFRAPQGVHVLRTAGDACTLSRELDPGTKLVVIGGGFLGAEVASSARTLGVDVAMLEAAPAPFERTLGRELGRLLAARYRANGVELLTETTAAGFRASDNGRVSAVVLSDGRELGCDTVLVAVGVEPAAELLDVCAAARVYTCGDVNGGGHWSAAAAEGVAAARAILDLDPFPVQHPYFWSDQFGLRIQLVGDPSRADRVALEGSADGFLARYYRSDDELLVAALAANRPGDIGALRRELALAA